MSWLQILILGVAVGFGEIFPLSGPGVSAPVRQLLGLPLDGSGDRMYSALLRMAVWLAVCLVLRRELWACLRVLFLAAPAARRRDTGGGAATPPSGPSASFGNPALIPALLLQTRAARLGTLPGVAVFLALNGLLLFLTDRVGHGKRDVRSATVADSLCMGLAQALSVVPGLSRTGLTMAAGILQGLSLEFSWKFSFLMAAPAMLLQSVVALLGALRSGAHFVRPIWLEWPWPGCAPTCPAAFAVCSSPGGLR